MNDHTERNRALDDALRLGGGGRVIARFPGHCEECEHPIREGDKIMPTEDGTWMHAKCTPPPDPLAHGDVCGACWLTLCDCEEDER